MKKRKSLIAVLAALGLFMISGCAVGNKYNYRDVVADISAPGSGAVGVAVHDQRDYVKSGEKPADFVGLQRGGFGNPFSVTTMSGRPLADDMTSVIAESLAKKGFKAIPVGVAPADAQGAVLEKLKATQADRMILLTLNEWKSDTYQNVALIYDVSLSVYDKKGKVLTEKKVNGRDNLGGSAWNPPAIARKEIPRALKEKLEQLLNSPETVKALQQ